jgi:hypothetical protein
MPESVRPLAGGQPSPQNGGQAVDGESDWLKEQARLRAVEERRKTLPAELAKEVLGIHEALASFTKAESAYWKFRQGHPVDGSSLDEILGNLVDAGIEVCKQLALADHSEVLHWCWQNGKRKPPKPAGRKNRLNFELPNPSPEDGQALRYWQLCRGQNRAAALEHVVAMGAHLTEESLSKVWQRVGELTGQLLTDWERDKSFTGRTRRGRK